jgi:hypothetical protein
MPSLCRDAPTQAQHTHTPSPPRRQLPRHLSPSRVRQVFSSALECAGIKLLQCPPAPQHLRARMALQLLRLLSPASRCLQMPPARRRSRPSCSTSERSITSKSSSTTNKTTIAFLLTDIPTGLPQATACLRAWPPLLSKNAAREPAPSVAHCSTRGPSSSSPLKHLTSRALPPPAGPCLNSDATKLHV